jgi:hypothetical protein
MKIRRVYVNPDDSTAVLECPHCGTARTRHVGKFKGSRRLVKIRCSCKSDFHVSFEFRKTRRKETNIQGYYARLPGVDQWEKMLITNISVAGIGLLTHNIDNVNIGDQLKVRFSLNRVRRSIVKKDAVVRWVADGNIGCEFTEPVGCDNTYEDAPLTCYLMH